MGLAEATLMLNSTAVKDKSPTVALFFLILGTMREK